MNGERIAKRFIKENLKEKKESLDKPIAKISKYNESVSNNAVVEPEDENVDYTYIGGCTIYSEDNEDVDYTVAAFARREIEPTTHPDESHKQFFEWSAPDQPNSSSYDTDTELPLPKLHYDNVDKDLQFVISGELLRLWIKHDGDPTKNTYTYEDITKFLYDYDRAWEIAHAYGQASIGQPDSKIDWATVRRKIHQNIYQADFHDDTDRSILKTPYSYVPLFPPSHHTSYYPSSPPSNEQTIKLFLQSNDPT